MLPCINIVGCIRGLNSRFHMFLKSARARSSIFYQHFAQNKTSTARMTPDDKETKANCGTIPVLPK